MKFILIILSVLASSFLNAQDTREADQDLDQDAYQDEYVEQTRADDEAGMAQNQTERVPECACPQNEVEQEVVATEASAPSIFPPGTAVNITPVPTDEKPASVQIKERDFPPAYVEKLPVGYSNNTFQPIGTSSQ